MRELGYISTERPSIDEDNEGSTAEGDAVRAIYSNTKLYQLNDQALCEFVDPSAEILWNNLHTVLDQYSHMAKTMLDALLFANPTIAIPSFIYKILLDKDPQIIISALLEKGRVNVRYIYIYI